MFQKYPVEKRKIQLKKKDKQKGRKWKLKPQKEKKMFHLMMQMLVHLSTNPYILVSYMF